MVINTSRGSLITMLGASSIGAVWARALALNSTGMGIVMQLPYTAVQLVLRYLSLSATYLNTSSD